LAEIAAEQRLVTATHALIDRFTAKIARVIHRVWEGKRGTRYELRGTSYELRITARPIPS
jgi:hypothetical protein